MNVPQINKLSRASQLSLVAVVILLGAVFMTVNSALQQENQASHASGATNIIINPSFESGTSPWFLNHVYPGAGTFTTTTSQHEDGSYAAQVNVTGISPSNSWYVQLQHADLPMQSGQPYTVTFWAKANVSRQIEALVQQTNSPYAVYGYKTYTISTSWQQYSFSFTPNTTQSNVSVEFNLAQSIGQVWIDNVSYSTGLAIPTAIPVPTATIVPAATATPTPTATPIPVPTAPTVPTNSIGVSPTSTPTTVASPIPTISYAAGSTLLNLTLGLQGIGTGGDSSNPNSLGNTTPHRPTRTVTVEIYDASNQLVVSQEGTVTYDPNSGKFIGVANLGQNFTTGLYTVKVKTDQFLRSLVPGIQTITSGQTNTLPVVSLVAGDINGDNQINIVDYNILIGCYSDLLPATNCTDTNNTLADLNDDGAVNEFDYNLFLRELSNVGGQ